MMGGHVNTTTLIRRAMRWFRNDCECLGKDETANLYEP
jgi:hypothetical protein